MRLTACLLVAAASLSLGACAGGMSLSKLDADPTIVTAGVSRDDVAQTDAKSVSDQMTIRNAVSSVNLQETKGPLAWANTETDSRGSIFDIVEVKHSAQLCRSFKTSRESFDGVSIYKGETCTSHQGGPWYMRLFKLL
ncbi:MAG: RT0821/Lpp0805 family surface protein [Mesorhizobium sp.]